MSMRNSGFRVNPKAKLLSEINAVPYIDVTLILLIIFMITAPIVQQAVTVDLPQTPVIDNSLESNVTTKPFVITVNKDGYYKTSESEGKAVAQEELSRIIVEIVARSKMNAKQVFYIQGDKDTQYKYIMYLFTVLKSNGVENVSLLTKPESAN